MILRKKINIVFIVISIIITPMIIFHLYWEQVNLSKEYPRINFNSSFSGTVVHIIHNHGVFIKLSNGTQFSIGGKYIDNKRSDLGLFIQKCDSINKKANSDSVIIIRRDKNYVFAYRH